MVPNANQYTVNTFPKSRLEETQYIHSSQNISPEHKHTNIACSHITVQLSASIRVLAISVRVPVINLRVPVMSIRVLIIPLFA